MPFVVVTNSDVVVASPRRSPLTAAVDRKHNVFTTDTTRSNIMNEMYGEAPSSLLLTSFLPTETLQSARAMLWSSDAGAVKEQQQHPLKPSSLLLNISSNVVRHVAVKEQQ
jgi:hypothetical protein